jgi:hypothetical protein
MTSLGQNTKQIGRTRKFYAKDFSKQLHLNIDIDQKCEFSCLLWSKDHWAAQAKKGQISFQQTKGNLSDASPNVKTLHELFSDSQFLNTIAQVYSRLFGHDEQLCAVKRFANCPFMGQREDLLRRGALATIFATILHKATLYAMLERHPLDSGLIHEEYADVYGVDLTNFSDLQQSLEDGRFDQLYEHVLERATQLAGIPRKPRICPVSGHSEAG